MSDTDITPAVLAPDLADKVKSDLAALHGTAASALPGLFVSWVEKWASEQIPMAEAKAVQYGSNSLAKKGWRFAQAQGRGVSQAEALELGATQYVLEKMDRVEDAILRRQLPGDDTWIDIAVYALMIGYIRSNGQWL